jgi:hypothetical protein
MKHTQIQTAQNYTATIQYVLGSFVVIALFAYAYLLCSSVAFAVSQKDLTYRAASMTETLAQLESQYLSETQSFSKERAIARGLTVIDSKIFVSAAPTFSSAAQVRVAN